MTKDKLPVKKKNIVGKVVSKKMDKTVVVEVVRTLKHPLFGKAIRKSKRYKVHNEGLEVSLGDMVLVSECAPISKTKHMKLDGLVAK